MSMKIKILRDRLSTATDPKMIIHIKRIIKELEEELPEPLSSENFASRLNQLTKDIS